jgi:hypothetical protein
MERSDERARLETAFGRFEDLPARGAVEDKRRLMGEIVDTLVSHAQGTVSSGHERIEATLGRLRLTSPEAPDHDALALELIDAAREHLADGHTHPAGSASAPPPPAPAAPPRPPSGDRDDLVEAASEGSFPASDPPSYAADPQAGRGDADPDQSTPR